MLALLPNSFGQVLLHKAFCTLQIIDGMNGARSKNGPHFAFGSTVGAKSCRVRHLRNSPKAAVTTPRQSQRPQPRSRRLRVSLGGADGRAQWLRWWLCHHQLAVGALPTIKSQDTCQPPLDFRQINALAAACPPDTRTGCGSLRRRVQSGRRPLHSAADPGVQSLVTTAKWLAAGPARAR